MTKIMYQVTSDFDQNKIQFEHLNSINHLISEQRKKCLFSIINNAKIEEVIPNLIDDLESQKKFTMFIKVILNSAIIQML